MEVVPVPLGIVPPCPIWSSTAPQLIMSWCGGYSPFVSRSVAPFRSVPSLSAVQSRSVVLNRTTTNNELVRHNAIGNCTSMSHLVQYCTTTNNELVRWLLSLRVPFCSAVRFRPWALY